MTFWAAHGVDIQVVGCAANASRPPGSPRAPAAGIGWTTTVLLEAHVVNLRDAAAQGSKGLLQPLLKRYQASAGAGAPRAACPFLGGQIARGPCRLLPTAVRVELDAPLAL
jgi:hypothetical protein